MPARVLYVLFLGALVMNPASAERSFDTDILAGIFTSRHQA